MNRRGAARELVLGGSVVVGAIVAALHEIPQPSGFWPVSYAAWATAIIASGAVIGLLYVVFGPFLLKKLRVFLKDEDSDRLLQEIVGRILMLPATGRLLREIVIAQFPERFRESEEFRKKQSELADRLVEVESMMDVHMRMLAAFESIPRTLGAIEQQGRDLQRQMTETQRNTIARAKEIAQKVEQSNAATTRQIADVQRTFNDRMDGWDDNHGRRHTVRNADDTERRR